MNELRKPQFNDEFDNYLMKQALKTTFSALELETLEWYMKMLGFDNIKNNERQKNGI